MTEKKKDNGKRFYFGVDAKKKRVFAVLFNEKLPQYKDGKWKAMFLDSNLQSVQVENNELNRKAIKKMLSAMQADAKANP